MRWYGNVENAQQRVESIDKSHTAHVSFNCKPSTVVCMRVPCQINSNPRVLEYQGGKVVMCLNNDALAIAMSCMFETPIDIPEPDMTWDGGWVLMLSNASYVKASWTWQSPSAVACCMKTPWRLEMEGPLRWKNTHEGIPNSGNVIINESNKDVECITKEDAQARCIIS